MKNTATASSGVKCEICGEFVHHIGLHLKKSHSETVEEYQKSFPDAPLMSEEMQRKLAEREAERKAESSEKLTMTAPAASVTPLRGSKTTSDLAEVFDLGEDCAGAKTAEGKPIKCPVYGAVDPEVEPFFEVRDDSYVFNIDLLKSILMAEVLNINLLFWGSHGTGKSTIIEQFHTRIKKPLIRVQHTINTEEADIVGQYVLLDGQTVWQPGLLSIAMRYGATYLADEYDFAPPSVTSVYQSVMETGKPLVVKNAPPEWRRIVPHENFRFMATGNTNGSGDDTGLYQGTQVMNAANYSRFGITREVTYMAEDLEVEVIHQRTKIVKRHAKMLVTWATRVRKAFKDGDVSLPVSPRELINAARMAITLGRQPKLTQGIELAFANRLNEVDRLAVMEFAKNIFDDG